MKTGKNTYTPIDHQANEPTLMKINQILYGHVLDQMKLIASESVHCGVTSPPYWGLRDYGIDPVIWDGAEGCEHEWGHESLLTKTGGNKSFNAQGGQEGFKQKRQFKDVSQGNFCQKCGAWCGCLGLEPTPERFIKHMVDIFREFHRILRKDGTLWLNLGDSYASSAGGYDTTGSRGTTSVIGKSTQAAVVKDKERKPPIGLKPKDLVGIPWRVALALQADGWYLRSDIIWHKPNPMPESVTDRPTKSHEYIFLLSKSPNYFYDAEAVKEKAVESDWSKRLERQSLKSFPDELKNGIRHKNLQHDGQQPNSMHLRRAEGMPDLPPPDGKRNKRTVWTVTTKPYSGAHFATFPPDLIIPAIKAGTSEKGCCSACGAPWERVVEKVTHHQSGSGKSGNLPSGKNGDEFQTDVRMGPVVESETVGWKPTCKCDAGTVPCVVFDPFMGSGTTAMVAKRLDRSYLGCEANPKYKPLIEQRLSEALGPLFIEEEEDVSCS